MKRILLISLTVVLLFTFGIVAGASDGENAQGVAMVNGQEYTSVQDALNAAGTGETVTLLSDVTLSAILEINKSIVLDGNGKTITSSAERAINVTGANGVTIENLTIVCSGERAINIIKNSTNVVINSVNATAANYAVCVTGSAPNAVVEINNSTLKGLNTVNIAGAGVQATVNGGKIICDDKNALENYVALVIAIDADNSIIKANGVEFEIGGDSYDCYSFAKNGQIIINDVLDEKAAVACIQYANNAYVFSTLKEALITAKNGETIKLINNVELTETLEISKNVTLDLNGYSIVYNVASTPSQNTYAILNKGNLTVKDTSENADGQICLVYTGASAGYSISTICNMGTLNVASGTINAESGVQSISYAIDNNSTVSNAVINVSGGYVIGGASGYSIRQYLNSTKYENALNVTGGEVWYVWAQSPNTYAHKLSINVSGGFVSYVCVYSYVGVIDCTNYEISLNADNMEYEPYFGELKEGYHVELKNGVYNLRPVLVSLEEIFKDKGYSVSPDGITRGYTVDHELLATYLEQNELDTLEFGAVFAIEKIDANAISRALNVLEKTNTYNVSIKGITESYYDLDLVLAIYVKVGNENKYVNENSEIVTADKIEAVTYNMLTKEDEE